MEFITNADAVWATVDLPTRHVDVPEWGGKVVVQGISPNDPDLIAYITSGTMEPDQWAFLEGLTKELFAGIVNALRNTATLSAVGGNADAPAVDDNSAAIIGRLFRVRDEWMRTLRDRLHVSDTETNARRLAGMLVLGVRKPDGTPLFTWDDADRLRRRNQRVANRVGQIIMDLSEVPSLEAAEGTFPAAP